MKPSNKPFVRRIRHGQRGQSLVLVATLLTCVFAAAAISIDFGYIYAAFQKLQASADAAAVAAGSVLPNGTLAVQNANLYSAQAGERNAIPGLTVTMDPPQFACSQQLVTQFNLVCPAKSGVFLNANAVQVVEHASVPTFFAKLFGVKTIPLTVTASARARGNAPVPANVVIVAQATGHTGGVADPNCPIANWPNGQTKFQSDCIKSGIRTILSQLWPCPQGQTCSGSNPYDEVSLMLFPGLKSTSGQAIEYTPCGYSNNIGNPIFTNAIDESYLASSNPVFTVVPLSGNYRTSTTSGLNGGASPLVQAVDWADGVGCSTTNYGYGNIWETDYAPAITLAQATLVANNRPNTTNVIILVSDGDAPGQGCPINGSCNGGGTAQCQQGVNAAKAAAAAGTTVFSIAYGSNTNGTCSTDSGLQACTAMQEMAISPGTYPNPDPSKFYSDQGGQVGNCTSSVNPSITSVTQIFQAIGVQLQTSALILNSTY